MYKLNVFAALYCFLTIAVYADKSESTSDSFCVVREHLFSTPYNFTALTDPKNDIVLHDPGKTIRMQLCSPLRTKCNGKEGYGICLEKDKREIGIGKLPPKVINEAGKIMFTFTGDDCTPKTKYTVNILMKCDYAAGNNSYPQLISDAEQCTFYMLWKTALACGPRTQTDCTARNGEFHYDLSVLTRYSENYVIPTGSGRTSPKIILNVCHSVIYEYNALCQMHSGACLKDATKPGLGYVNLGDVQYPPVFEDGKLKIEYQDGDMCKVRNTTVPHIKTTILFICDHNLFDTIPEYVRGSEECHYQLIWKTIAACSIESLRSRFPIEISPGKCKVSHPLYNVMYNLQSLTDKDFYTATKNGVEYKFGICGSPKSMSCKATTGVCLTKNATSMGKVNTNLMWREGGPYLNYTDGDPCQNGKRYTIIAFVCGAEGSPSVPIVMEENSCELVINWYTDLVCNKRVKCATADDEINLTSLIKSTNNYIVKVNRTEFHINICRPLVPTPGLTCPHGSAICKTLINANKEYVNETNLGFPKESPVYYSKGRQIELHYTRGSPCPEDPDKLTSSNFTFPCRYDTKGFPEYKTYENCTYFFEWKTSITCGAVMGNWTSPCIIRDQSGSHECNLSLLYKDQQIHRVKNRQGKDVYSVSICGGKTFCNGSAVCQGSNGYGSLANVIFDYSRDVIKLQYSNGGKCVNSSYTSEVRFICDEAAGIGEPKLLWESQCSAEFEWHTNATCNCQSISHRPTGSSDVEDTEINGKIFSSSHMGTVAGVVLSVITLLAVLLYFKDPSKRACVRSCLKPVTSRRSAGRVRYCRVNTTEEARLLLDEDPTQCLTDSDDDLLNA